MKKSPQKRGSRQIALTTTLVVAALALLLAGRAGMEWPPTDTQPGEERLAQGILVQPDAGALEPPSIADQDDEGDDDDDSGENVPDVVAPSPGVIQVVPAMPESRQEGLERPGARQDDTERGDSRQQDMELPQGPGVKY